MVMGMPSITIEFQQLGKTAIQRSEKGILGMIIVDAAADLQGEHLLTSASMISTVLPGLGVANKAQIQLAFMGYITPPRRIIVFVIDDSETTLENALHYFATQELDYIIGPPEMAAADVQSIVSWVKSERLNGGFPKAVLPNIVADNDAIINFATEKIIAGENTFTTNEYCSRIAGIIAGTPMTISATYAPLPEVTNCTRLTKLEMDAAVDAGKFIIWHDGRQVLTGRAVNSLTTLTQEKGDRFKKIKIIEAMDMMARDIKTAARVSYIGKYANSYDNKCLLIMAILGYLEGLEMSGILVRGSSVVEIDVDENELYLKAQGIDTSDMSEQELKESDTGSSVFLLIRVIILDAIEDIKIKVTI